LPDNRAAVFKTSLRKIEAVIREVMIHCRYAKNFLSIRFFREKIFTRLGKLSCSGFMDELLRMNNHHFSHIFCDSGTKWSFDYF